MNERLVRVIEYIQTIPCIMLLKLKKKKQFRVGLKQRWEKNCKMIIKNGIIVIDESCNFRSGVRFRAVGGL